jgi:hypothetical protein
MTNGVHDKQAPTSLLINNAMHAKLCAQTADGLWWHHSIDCKKRNDRDRTTLKLQ